MAKILVVDDDVELCEEIAEILTDEGYETAVVNDAPAGGAAAREGDYDLLLLDLKMPSLNGHEILKDLRDRGVKRPVLVVTGNPLKTVGSGEVLPDDPRQAVLALADGVVAKPFDIPLLLAKIKSLI